MSRAERATFIAIFVLSGLISYAVINTLLSQPEPHQPVCRNIARVVVPCE